MLQKLYKYVMPDVCCLCDTNGLKGLDLCHACHISLPHNLNCCRQCAIPFSNKPQLGNQATICGSCLRKPLAIDHAIIPYLYRPPTNYMIKRLKFSAETKFSRLLGELLADAVETDQTATSVDLLLPVPIHHERLLQRGFNQAEMLAATVARRLGLPMDVNIVSRSAMQLPQKSLSARKREENMRSAFQVNDKHVSGLHIAIVDDVYTTGATVNSIARQLKKAGAARISTWAVARTP